MVFAKSLSKVLVIASMIVLRIRPHVCSLGVLLQMRDIVRGVATLEHSRGCLILLLALPEQVAAERGGQLGGEHLAASRAG